MEPSSVTTTYDTPLLTALAEVGPHDHHSLIYESPEDHYGVAIPFIRIGLERGEKCIYIADDGSYGTVRDAMSAEGIDVERAIADERLVLETKDGAFLRNGSFDPERMPAFWKDATAAALKQGFSALRATGETEWVICGGPGFDRWHEYESRLTEVLADLNCFALCQYNRSFLPPEFILDVIRTHPTVIYRGVVCRNVYHVPPEEFLSSYQPADEVERLLTTVRERAEIEQTLRQQRNELRVLANRLMHAQDDERRRIATTLHETTSQDLAALKMLLARLNRDPKRLSEDERKALAEGIELADQATNEIRKRSTRQVCWRRSGGTRPALPREAASRSIWMCPRLSNGCLWTPRQCSFESFRNRSQTFTGTQAARRLASDYSASTGRLRCRSKIRAMGFRKPRSSN
jgi:hypothetical protein